MTLVQIPTEQTTAATDLLISVLAVASINYLHKHGPDGLRGQLWRYVFLFLAIAGLLGAAAHGLVLGATAFIVLWWGVYLALALLIAAFFLASVRDLYGDDRARQLLPGTLLVATAFFAYFVMDPDNFLPFILYEAIVMVFALGVFAWLAWRQTLAGAAWIAAAIALNIVAAIVQATGSVQFTLIWSFDHNGAFHLVQIAAMAFLVHGLRQATLQSRRS